MATAADQLNFNEIYNFAIEITRDCESVFREGFYGAKKVTSKELAWDLVTDFDQRIESILKSRILDKYPNHLFIGEETSANEKTVVELTDAPTWIIDPIDGTHNFVNQIPFCAISVAFLFEKELIVGVVNSPITNEAFTALRQNGSYLNGQRITTAGDNGPIDLSHDEILKKTKTVIPRLMPGVDRIGSAALALAYIANGTLTGFYTNFLKSWDVAAGILILREAGGVVHAHDGSEMNLMKPDIIAAVNEAVGQELIKIFKDVDFTLPDDISKLAAQL